MRHLIVTAAALLAATAVLGGAATPAAADRIKDLTTVKGIRTNHLTGYGLVVGLGGTGDDANSPIVRQALAKALKRLGATIDPGQIKAKNVAAVMVTAELPAFAKPGMAIDVTASSMGGAKSLTGGMLIATALQGPDGRTWAIAQGSVAVGGFAASGGTGSSAQKNQTTVGLIAGGAIVEAAAPSVLPDREIVLNLNTPDATTATRMTDAINAALGEHTAVTRDEASVVIQVTATSRGQVPALLAKLEAIEVDPDLRAMVVVDEKTGTIVIGEAVRLRPAAISFGALTVEISEQPVASQPGPLGQGNTAVVPRTDIKVNEANNPLRMVNKASTVADVAAALATLGAKPRDLVSILLTLRRAGALRAEVVIQ
jgi:flagellar P-ring protein precursor FlgI